MGLNIVLTSCFDDHGIEMQALCHGVCVTTSFAYIVIPVFNLHLNAYKESLFSPQTCDAMLLTLSQSVPNIGPTVSEQRKAHSLPTQDCFPIIIHFLQYNHMAHIE